MFRRVTIYLWLALFLMGATVCFANPSLDIADYDGNGEPFTGMAGDRGPNALTIPVSIINDPDVGQVASLGLVVKYDPTLLEFKSVDSLDGNKQGSTNINDPNWTAGEVKILFAGINNSTILNGADGAILNLRFNILATAKPGETTVEMTADPVASTPDASEIPMETGNNLANVTIDPANPAGALSLKASPEAGGTVTADPAYDADLSYNIGNTVNLMATAATGYTFSSWSCTGVTLQSVATSAQNSVIMSASDAECTALFSLNTYTLTLKSGTANSGSFSTDPVPYDPSSGAQEGANKFVPGTSVAITFTPADGYTFTGWTGSTCVSGTSMDNPLTVVMSRGRTCTATVALSAVDGDCGASDGGIFPLAPTEGLCSAGTASDVIATDTTWDWTCAGENGGQTVACSAKRQVGGSCGDSAGGNYLEAPADGLCAVGEASAVAQAGDQWTWSCTGVNGGEAAACTANVQSDAACGGSAGGNYLKAPTADLCADGSVPDVGMADGLWSWTCAGAHGGADAVCTANVLVPIDGACGASNASEYLIAPTEGLCDAGAASDVSETATGWAWTCAGENGGTDASCSATALIPVPGECGASNTGSFLTTPTEGLCNMGAASDVTTTDTGWAWSCAGVNGAADASCSATALIPVPGKCGAGAGGNYLVAPATDLCASGDASEVIETETGWVWICQGSNGGTSETCTANLQVNGDCGGSNGQFFAEAPSTDLCTAGTPSEVIETEAGWVWICEGVNEGTSETCTATLQVESIPPVAQNQDLLTKENTSLAITLVATDEDNDSLVYTVVAEPTHGTLTGSDNSLIYQPDTAYVGQDSFTFKANDGQSDSNPATVTITVTDDPTLIVSTLADGSVTNKAILNISGTVTDADGVASLTINGKDVALLAGSFSYLYTLAVGTNQIEVKATDIHGNTTTDSRTITFEPSGPQLTVTAPADNSRTKNLFVDVEGTVDEEADVTISVNGEPPVLVYQGQGAFTTTAFLVADSQNTIEITATNVDGYSSKVKRTVTNDSKAPGLVITDPVADTETAASIYVLKGTVSNDAASVKISFDGNIYYPAIVDGAFEKTLSLPTAKTYTATVTATDDVGNSAVVTRNIVKQAVWTNVTAMVDVTKSSPVYNRILKAYYVLVKVTNPAGEPLPGALRMVVTDPSPALQLLTGGLIPDGTTVDGEPYFNLLGEGETLAAVGSISNLRLNFQVLLPITFGVRIEQLK